VSVDELVRKLKELDDYDYDRLQVRLYVGNTWEGMYGGNIELKIDGDYLTLESEDGLGC